ncbi:MAG: hypothetical protein IPP66_01160 [Anaerolineales bacterium]|nr:hypothetical protein [Anaerolineales bacterium]
MSEVPRMSLETLTDLIEQFLPVQEWGFTENVRVEAKEPFVIYNSEWCRIRFFLERDRYEEYLHISYGRLHAQNSSRIMKWNGKDCRCWFDYRDLPLIFSFLDDLSPHEAYRAFFSFYEKDSPKHPLFQKDLDSRNSNTVSLSIESRTGESLKFHSSIWSYYKIRFFELFDLRRPDLWEKYANFLRDAFEPDDYERYFPPGKLPEYQVC